MAGRHERTLPACHWTHTITFDGPCVCLRMSLLCVCVCVSVCALRVTHPVEENG